MFLLDHGVTRSSSAEGWGEIDRVAETPMIARCPTARSHAGCRRPGIAVSHSAPTDRRQPRQGLPALNVIVVPWPGTLTMFSPLP